MQFCFCFEYFLICLRVGGVKGLAEKDVFTGVQRAKNTDHRPTWGPQVPSALASKLRERSGRHFPFPEILFPSCDPALAWESAQDRPQLSLPSRAVSGQELPSQLPGRRGHGLRPCRSAPPAFPWQAAVVPKEGYKTQDSPGLPVSTSL